MQGIPLLYLFTNRFQFFRKREKDEHLGIPVESSPTGHRRARSMQTDKVYLLIAKGGAGSSPFYGFIRMFHPPIR